MRKYKLLIAAAILFTAACSSNSGSSQTTESAAPEPTPEEKQVVKVEINKDNLLDYFELYEEPILWNAVDLSQMPQDADRSGYIDNGQVEEQYRNGEIPMGFGTMIKLKDEYASQLDFDDNNKVDLAFSATLITYTTEGDGTQKNYGEPATVDEYFALSFPNEQTRPQMVEIYKKQGWITEDGYISSSYSDGLTIEDNDLIDGVAVGRGEPFVYRSIEVPAANGVSFVWQVSEGPAFIGKQESFEWTNVSGTLFLHQ